MIIGNSTEVINPAEFEQFFDEVCVGEFEILEELVTDLRTEGQALVDSIVESFEKEDLPVLNRAAHTLKSSTKFFGGVLVSQQAAQIELLANPEAPGDFGTVANAVGQVQESFDQFLKQLDSIAASKKA